MTAARQILTDLTMCHTCGRMHSRAQSRECASCGTHLEHRRGRTRSCAFVDTGRAAAARGSRPRLRRDPHAPILRAS